MKKYFLNKTGESSNTFSVYENPDKKLKEEIASFDIDRSKVTLGWPEKEWEILEWEKDEVKCKHGRDISYFKRQEIEEALTENLEDARNKKHQAYQHFKKAFGIISYIKKYNNKIYGLRKIDLSGAIPFGMDEKRMFPINTRSVEFYRTFFDYDLNIGDDSIYLKTSESGCSLNLYFDKNGNYVNRDYNEDFNLYECEDVSPLILFENFEKSIKKLEGLQYSRGKYYTDKFCYIPYYNESRGDLELGVEIIPVREDGKSYQKYSGHPIYKRPAKLEYKTSEDLLEDVKSLMTPKFKWLLNLEKELVES